LKALSLLFEDASRELPRGRRRRLQLLLLPLRLLLLLSLQLLLLSFLDFDWIRWPKLVRGMGKPAIVTVFAPPTLREAAHFHLEETAGGPQLRLTVSKAAVWEGAMALPGEHLAHAGVRQVRLVAYLIRAVSV
jgi:hypothetical protein